MSASADPNAKDRRGLTPLHVAAGIGDASEVRLLLATGADPHVLDSVMGASPLHHGAQSGSVAVAQLLLGAGAFVNLQAPTHGVTPLMAAVWFRKPAFVECLLARVDVNVEIRSNFGSTAEELIGFGTAGSDDLLVEQDRVLRLLFESHDQRRRAEMASQALVGALLDESMAAEGRAEAVRRLIAGGESLEAAWPVCSSGTDGHTALLVAARDGNAAAVAALLDAGADQTATDHYMRAVPAHKAAYMGHVEVLRLLVAAERFAEVKDAQGPFNGYTPLHDASWHGHADAALVLLEAGARTDLKGFDGKTPGDLAREYGYHELAASLNSRAGPARN